MKRSPIIPIKWINEQHDSDWDGVPNFRDCNPWNPHEHGLKEKFKERLKKKRCSECGELKYKTEFKNGSYICKECGYIIMRKKYKAIKRKKYEAYKRRKSRRTMARRRAKYHRCPFCKSSNIRLIQRSQFDHTGDIYKCQRCHRQIYGYQLDEMRCEKDLKSKEMEKQEKNISIRNMSSKKSDQFTDKEKDMIVTANYNNIYNKKGMKGIRSFEEDIVKEFRLLDKRWDNMSKKKRFDFIYNNQEIHNI